MSKSWLIYGAYGYTGRLITLEAKARGLQPIIGGRSAGPLTRLAAETGLKHVVLGLDEKTKLKEQLSKTELVLNCAGPFSSTAQTMIEACLVTNTHYLDITGEIDVFEYAQSKNQAATASNMVICPGVGFDVVPTDCLAATLKNAMHDATHLSLGFDSRSKLSPGTAKTTFSKLPSGGRVRVNGKIKEVPLGYHTRNIIYKDIPKLSVTIPWGDVSTAYHTTGIPNIETYIPASEKLIQRLRLVNKFRRMLNWGWIQKFVQGQIENRVQGPSKQSRSQHTTDVWGEVRNATGDVRTARVTTANGYSLTVEAAVLICETILKKSDYRGAMTPSQIMGAHFVSQLTGSSNIEIT